MKTDTPQPGEILLQALHVSKTFAGVQALQDVSLTLRRGEVHALMGENGAGKSTLMKVFAGLHQPDSGQIQLSGRPVTLRTPHEALQHGIALIHQELMPVPDLTVAENILLGQEPASRFLGWLDRRSLDREARRLLGLLGLDLDVTRKMRELSVAQMQTVEIARALGRKAEVVLMDEPTAAISDHEVEALFTVIRTLKNHGTAIVYVTHKMDEVFRVADRITVLRDGTHIATHPAADLDRPKLIGLMVGRALPAPSSYRLAAQNGTALSVRGLSRAGAFLNVSFEAHRGEILGFAGLLGAGRTELAYALYGLAPADSGEIRVHGQPVRIRHPRDAIGCGLGLVTEDRQGFGLVPVMSVKQNLTLAALGDSCLGPFVQAARETAAAAASVRDFSIKTTGLRQAVADLSGGNQQKVVIARTLMAQPSIVILDEPTRGIDIGAKAEVHAIIARLAQEGKCVLLISSELPELLSLSDRVLVMCQGRITAELERAEATQEEILKHAMPD